MTADEIHKKLHDLRILKYNWYSIGETIVILRNTYKNSYPSRRIREASEHCGYSTNTLTRMASVKEFYDEAIKNLEVEQIDPNTVSFPSLEIVKRLYQEDADNGQKMFLKVLNGEITHRELREKYDQIKTKKEGYSSGYLLRKEYYEFEQKSLYFIKSNVRQIFGDVDNISYKQLQTNRLADISVTARSKSALTYHGFLFKIFSNHDKLDRTEYFFYKLLAHTNYFDAYWLVLPSKTNNRKINALETLLDLYDKQSCGIMLIPWHEDNDSGIINILRNPSGKPTPDLREKDFVFKNNIKALLH